METRVELNNGVPPPVVEKGDEWQEFAACKLSADQNLAVLFFPPTKELKKDRLDREAQAKRVCGGCAVKQYCLDYAITNNEEFGVWGGMTEKERAPLRRRFVASNARR